MTNPNDLLSGSEYEILIQNPAGTTELNTPDGVVKFERIKMQKGLTKREYFAAMALQGYLASCAGLPHMPRPENAAIKSVDYADALITALNETK